MSKATSVPAVPGAPGEQIAPRPTSEPVAPSDPTPTPWIVGLRNEIRGGIMSSLLAIPLALGYGMFAFVSLGDDYFAEGARAGLVAAFVTAVVCVVLGARGTTVYAPRIATTFFLGLLLRELAHSVEPALQSAPPTFKLLVLFSIVLVAGLLQALFGVLKLGSLMKFAPHPVVAGFQNMAAALLFLVQTGDVLGFDHHVRFVRVAERIADAKPLSILVAAITFLSMWYANRITTKVPPLLLGLGIGVAAYYGLCLAGLSPLLGPAIGMPDQSIFELRPNPFDAATMHGLANLSHMIFSAALALALIASFDGMLCHKLANPGDVPRDDSNRLLIRLGLANAVSAAAGGITSGINIGPSIANRTYGGRSWISVIVNAAMLLAALVILLPIVTYLPQAVLSAAIMVVAIQHIDPWSKQALARLLSSQTVARKAVALDLFIAFVVSILSIAVNIVLAVFLGFALAVLLFVLRMSQSNIRRRFRGDRVHSRKTRSLPAMRLLEAEGSMIRILELQAALFFGSAELLAQAIEHETEGATRTVILDFRRVTEVDATGVHILEEIAADLARRKIALSLVLNERSDLAWRLANVPGDRFPDVDRAIEHAEDALLEFPAEDPVADAAPTREHAWLTRAFTSDQIARLRRYLEHMQWPAGTTIFKEGEPGTHLFLMMSGHASVRLTTPDGDIRLATFAPGTVFGELAILDHGPRSATVTADDEVAAWALSANSFEALQAEQPDIAIRILSVLSHELCSRLRHANLSIHQLEA